MNEIIKTLIADYETLGMLLFCLGTLMIINIILGSYNALLKGEFVWKTLFVGFCKAVIIVLAFALFMLVIEILPIPLKALGIELGDVPKVVEVLAILVVAIKNYVTDIYEKFVTIFNTSSSVVKDILVREETEDPVIEGEG